MTISHLGYRLGVLAVLICHSLPAQQSAIQGIVTDSSGAALPRAQVSVTNTRAGRVQTTATNEQGFYSVPFLVPGEYSIKAFAKGFTTRTLTNLTLDIGATARADFALEVGKVDTTVEVSASTTALIETETTTVGQTIGNEQVVELPLNDRNYLELAMLTPGATPADGARSADAGSFTAAGSRANQTNIMLDGVDNASRLSGGQLGWEAQAVTPSVDAVQEFRVVTNNNSAEFGFRMGGNVMVQTKSGSNRYHGSLYEFLRHDKFAANNFFANRAEADQTVYKRNQFGATYGGKIIRDKTFFFGSYEGKIIHVGEVNSPSVPLAAFKRGDFSSPAAFVIYDPATTRVETGRNIRDPFPGNRIPGNRLDPVGAKVASWFPNPTLPGDTRNYFYSPVNTTDTHQFDGRLDHTFNSANRAFLRYSRRHTNNLGPGPLPLPADGGLWTTVDVLATSWVANWSAVISPSASNEFRFGFTRSDSAIDIPSRDTPASLGIKGVPDFGPSNDHGVTRFAITDYSDLGSRSFWPNPNVQNIFHISDHLTKVHSRHFVKIGVEFRKESLSRHSSRYSRGVMNFNASFTQDPNNRARTGESLADLLLGDASGGTLSNINGELIRTLNYAAFFQDDLKVTRRLTLNLGVRWDRFGIPSFADREALPVGLFILGPPGSSNFELVRPKSDSDCGCRHDNKDFAPRIGFAYQLWRSTVIRSGFGLYYGTLDSYDGAAVWHNGPPDYAELTFPTDRLVQPALVISQGFPTGLFPVTAVPQNIAIPVAQPFRPSQYAIQYFFDVQQRLPKNTVVTLSYIGNGSRKLVWNRDINTVSIPGPGTIKNRQPWPFFGAITTRQSGGNTSYNAFALKGEKRFSHGFSYLASYTWSHMIDDGAGTLGDGVGTWRDPNKISLDRSNANYDRRHNVVATMIYDLPFGRTGKWGRGWHPMLNSILGGWQLAGVGNFRTGRYFSVTVTGNPANTSGTNYANRIREGSLPADERSIDNWFDKSAFAIPAQYTIGNGGRNIIPAPRSRNLDLKIGKNFRVAEKYRVEFRTEMFNATNTPNFGTPNGVLNNVNAGKINSASAARVMQFAVKVIF
ncbi:MAG TPA: TonB-dependent receptor [Bryobacteraceae bacterium]|nr:TonB-dependent receptor [Bryobacteraceae bacterium]